MSRLERVLDVAQAAPEARFAAGMIASAVQEARLGDREAYRWLERCGMNWLSAIVPDNVDPETIHRALLAQAAPRGAWQSKLELEMTS
ncbi:hypothetical protein [Nitrolancea hollandica]|uniref:Uncharacterized protein n=1 Tax=Nitrolancea hollandica Lb TaxID=1129897 RepID=I4EHH2_9BACT|nr:hypothetical protein [Nitrolancea hollandica]CCF84134.1 conserved hypothetical protein [Nitrolancea hollandica Lb]